MPGPDGWPETVAKSARPGPALACAVTPVVGFAGLLSMSRPVIRSFWHPGHFGMAGDRAWGRVFRIGNERFKLAAVLDGNVSI